MRRCDMTCPNCGKRLLHDLDPADPSTPPYQCLDCVRGWWPAEITKQAREAWDPTTRSFTKKGIAKSKEIEAVADSERSAEVARRRT